MNEKKTPGDVVEVKSAQNEKTKKCRRYLVCHDPSPDFLKNMDLIDPVTGKPRDTGPPRA